MNFDAFCDRTRSGPLRAWPDALVLNSFNGSSENRIRRALGMCREQEIDGVVYFCHWGCKQTLGAAGNARAMLEAAGYPVLILDGDGCHRNNSETDRWLPGFRLLLRCWRRKKHDLVHVQIYAAGTVRGGFSAPTERLPEETDDFERADSLGHPNLCGYGKALLEAALGPEVRELVLVNCCDVARRMYDILEEKRFSGFLYLLDLPHRGGPEEKKLFQASLRRLKESYEAYSGRGFDVQKAWAALPEKEPEEREEPCVSFAGAHGGERLLDHIRTILPVRIRNDTCSGRRRLTRPADPPKGEDEFFERYAALLLDQYPCMRMEDVGLRKTQDPSVRGIIYHT